MFLLTPSSNGTRGSGTQRRPLTPAEAVPVSCSVHMGALCWVLPVEDEEVLEEDGGIGVVEQPLEETSTCQEPQTGLLVPVSEGGTMLVYKRWDSSASSSFCPVTGHGPGLPKVPDHLRRWSSRE